MRTDVSRHVEHYVIRARRRRSRNTPTGAAACEPVERAGAARCPAHGVAYLSNTTIDDAFALGVCIVNHRARETDLEILLPEIRIAARNRYRTPTQADSIAAS
jgi:hypothetical protein